MSGILSTNLFSLPLCNAAYFFVTVFALKAGHHCPGTNVVFLYYLGEQQGVSELVAVQ